MNTEEILSNLKKHKAQISEQFKTETIGLFGSYSENKQTAQSDIDLLVSFKKGNKDLFNFINLKFYLEEILDNKVDLINRDGIKPALKDRILQQVKYV